MIEKIHKEFNRLALNNHSEIIRHTGECPIDFELEYDETNSMGKDLIKELKDKNVYALSLTMVNDRGFLPEIEKTILELAWVDKIIIRDYYMLIDGRKILFNGIFNFYGINY